MATRLLALVWGGIWVISSTEWPVDGPPAASFVDDSDADRPRSRLPPPPRASRSTQDFGEGGEGGGKATIVPSMPRPRGLLLLALTTGVLVGGCRDRNPVLAPPKDDATVSVVVEIDAIAVCEAGCERLTRCAPDLAADKGGATNELEARLARECSPACVGFAGASANGPGAALRLEIARDAAFALDDCLDLDSCNSFWGCVSTESARPWLAAVAPVGERTCENLCSQASACAIAKVCDDQSSKDVKREAKDDAACLADDARRSELEESCLLQCVSTPDESQARRELIGCLDHVSCGGLLGCLDSWADTAYERDGGPTPGISQTCDDFCTRAIDCGARSQGVELTPAELAGLREVMTSTWVECAVQCEKDLASGEAQQKAFEQCTAATDCETFSACADAA